MDSSLLAAVRAGDRRALSQAITLVEKGDGAGDAAPDTPPIVGFTGPPGAGKSTLIAALLEKIRARGESVAVLAVDPSSPVTGGAILGDRIRMQAHVEDPGVYIRSMATRGHLGGLSEAAGDAVALMRLAGFDRVFVETVGVGQSEVEVMGLANVVVLVVGPSWGDQVQADKAGVVEVADLFVVNKSDRPGASEVKRALTEAAQARNAEVLLVSATTGEGVDEVVAEIDRLAGA